MSDRTHTKTKIYQSMKSLLMDKISVSITEEQMEKIEELSSNEFGSKSETVRKLLEKAFKYDRLKAENQRLEKKLQEANSKNQEIKRIKEKVDRQEEYLGTPFFIRWYNYFRKNE